MPKKKIHKIKPKTVRKKSSSQKPDIRKLKDENTRTVIANSFSASMANIAASDNPMEKWNKAKQTIGNIYEEQLKPTYHKKKEWMTEEILQLMDTRRKYKNSNPDKYRETHGKLN